MTTTSRGGPPPSLLFADPPPPRERGEREDDRSYARDLNLDQVVAAVATDREECELITEILYGHLRDADAVRYRQEVFRDLEDPALLGEIQHFADQMAEVGAHLRQLASMPYRYHRGGLAAGRGGDLLARDTSDTKDALGRIRYGTRIRGTG